MVVNVTVDPDKAFQKAFEDAFKKIGDLTTPLKAISQRWYKSNKSIFTLKGPGQYTDLSPRYKKRKLRTMGQIYPILLGENGRIRDAITDTANENAYNEIVNKNSLLLGVTKSGSFKYPMAHHLGSPKQNIPARPFLFTGAEQILPRGHEKAKQIYLNILADYVLQKSSKFGVIK